MRRKGIYILKLSKVLLQVLNFVNSCKFGVTIC